MSISVNIRQELDGEVLTDIVKTFKTKKQFKAAMDEAIENWKVMQGRYSKIEHDIVDGSLRMSVASNDCDDTEIWTLID